LSILAFRSLPRAIKGWAKLLIHTTQRHWAATGAGHRTKIPHPPRWVLSQWSPELTTILVVTMLLMLP